MLPGRRYLAAAVSAILLSLAFGGPARAAAPSSRLAGETLTGSAVPPAGLPLGANGQCSLGRNRTHFAFTGTASGPYTGTFTEAGHITYTLVPNDVDFFPEGGVVMHFCGTVFHSFAFGIRDRLADVRPNCQQRPHLRRSTWRNLACDRHLPDT